MELQESIRSRRSVRKYWKKPIPDEVIRQILAAGMDAPSAGNLQSRHFYVVSDDTLKRSLGAAAYDQNFVSEASVVVVVCMDNRISAEYGKRGVDLYAIMDCAASIQNMLLLAHSLGVGTCWVGAFDERKVSELLNLPARFRPIAIIPHGYPAESPEPPSKIAFEDACDFI